MPGEEKSGLSKHTGALVVAIIGGAVSTLALRLWDSVPWEVVAFVSFLTLFVAAGWLTERYFDRQIDEAVKAMRELPSGVVQAGSYATLQSRITEAERGLRAGAEQRAVLSRRITDLERTKAWVPWVAAVVGGALGYAFGYYTTPF